MGLVARRIEAAGMVTACLSNIPELTAAVGAPRVVGLEHPFGQVLGEPGDAKGQKAVLGATFRAMESMGEPGELVHLPFRWPESRGRVRGHPPVPPPIATYLKKHPWHFPRLVTRQIPGE